MLYQSQHLPTQEPPSTSPSKSSDVADRGCNSHRRRWLGVAAALILVCMFISLVATAHVYYHQWGGQGYLINGVSKVQPSETTTGPAFHPHTRKIGVVEVKGHHPRSPNNVPFLACGDQQHSCEAYNQPGICCPAGMICYPTTLTTSRIFCCNATTPTGCNLSRTHPPRCLPGSVECSRETGGGCCHDVGQCSPNGCIQITNSSFISFPSSYVEPLAPGSSMAATHSSFAEPGGTTERSSTGTVTSIVVEIPAATATLVKQGEIAQEGAANAAKDSVLLKVYTLHPWVWEILGVALLMGLL